ncbi:hypothetical protein CP978_11645 [Streptomyces nodosus]|uniref:Uncharacterized protein n=1 Tax=Streptomyces nodosus TaxID=40318 RepID=A0A5P2W0E2_9ACTN|nr:hypothetical protein CP978_11645 [Streptomyces nodosus]
MLGASTHSWPSGAAFDAASGAGAREPRRGAEQEARPRPSRAPVAAPPSARARRRVIALSVMAGTLGVRAARRAGAHGVVARTSDTAARAR